MRVALFKIQAYWERLDISKYSKLIWKSKSDNINKKVNPIPLFTKDNNHVIDDLTV